MAQSTRKVLSVVEEEADTVDHARSTAAEQQDMHSPIGSVGAMLREGRRRHGLDIATVSEALRIRKTHLSAIEEGRFDDLPGTVYAIGFVRTYAEFLDLDAPYLVDLYKDEAARIGPAQALNFPAPVPENRMPVGAIALISLALLGVGYGGWLFATSGDNDVATLVPELSDRITELVATDPAAPPAVTPVTPPEIAQLSSLTDRLAPLPASPLPPPTLVQAAPTPSADTPSVNAAPTDGTASDTTTVAVAGPAQPSTTAPPIAPRSEPSQALAAPPPVPPAVEDTAIAGLSAGRVVLQATADSWVQIRDGDGDLVMSRVLRPGEEYTLPDGLSEGVTMVTGNAGGLGILLDGRLLPALGGDGEVVRNISLDIADLAN